MPNGDSEDKIQNVSFFEIKIPLHFFFVIHMVKMDGGWNSLKSSAYIEKKKNKIHGLHVFIKHGVRHTIRIRR